MNKASPYAPLRMAALLFTLLLCACSSPPPQEPAPVKKHARHATPPAPPPATLQNVIEYPADAYLLHLSLAQVSLQAGTDVASSAADYDIAQAYSLQKQTGNVLQPVMIIEYSIKDQKGHKHIIVPFSMSDTGNEFPELNEVMIRLNSVTYAMYDLKLAVVTLPPPDAMGKESDDNTTAQRAIAEIEQPLIKKALPLPPMAQARIDLELTRFFMAHHSRDTAYITIENAKQSLAAVDESAGDAETVRKLSHDIETQEGLLHKNMPFTLDF